MAATPTAVSTVTKGYSWMERLCLPRTKVTSNTIIVRHNAGQTLSLSLSLPSLVPSCPWSSRPQVSPRHLSLSPTPHVGLVNNSYRLSLSPLPPTSPPARARDASLPLLLAGLGPTTTRQAVVHPPPPTPHPRMVPYSNVCHPQQSLVTAVPGAEFHSQRIDQ